RTSCSAGCAAVWPSKSQPNGTAASVPNVPGATGASPDPKPVARKIAKRLGLRCPDVVVSRISGRESYAGGFRVATDLGTCGRRGIGDRYQVFEILYLSCPGFGVSVRPCGPRRRLRLLSDSRA